MSTLLNTEKSAPNIALLDHSAGLVSRTVKTPAGELVLSAWKTVYSPQHRALFVADVHLGKAHTFRQLGVPVPQGTTGSNLQRLSQAIAHFQPEQLVVLGDLLHSRHALNDALNQQVLAWADEHTALRKVLVRGNHDDKAGDPPKPWGFEVVDEPFALGQLALCHYPQSRAGQFVLAGHQHPACIIRGAGRSRVRLPCFHVQQGGITLPSFGQFTGAFVVQPAPGEQVVAVLASH